MNMIEFLQELNEKRNCLSEAAAAFLDELIEKNKNNLLDFSEVKGQEDIKRAEAILASKGDK